MRARPATPILALACLALAALASCGEPSERPATPPSDRPAAGTPSSPAAPPSPETRPPSTAAVGATTACIRGGSTRDEVIQVMGPPDSVVFGAYVYGHSQILFGYGVVQEWSNAGANLILC